jgi:transcription elongation factor Elf1
MHPVDLKYAGFMSVRLDRFSIKQNNPYKANCRCPICGDSQKSKTKARGWILEKDNLALYYCHNCNASMSLKNFLKIVEPALYNEYIIDMGLEKRSRSFANNEPIEEKSPLDTLTQKRPAFVKKGSPLLSIDKVSSLPSEHFVKKYLQNRRIPGSKHYKLYYASKFNEWVNSLLPGKMPSDMDEPRLVLPFIDKNGTVFGFQGRALRPSSLRYITIMLDETMPKVFGLETVSFSKKYYVTEGPIDSLFLSNAVAMAGADGNAGGLDNVENAVFVFDNEPRNKQIVQRMESCLDKGYTVCMWPNNIVDKDINDMILSGIKLPDIELIIDNNSYKGLSGKLQLSYWRKC